MAIGGKEFVMDFDDIPESYKIDILVSSPDPSSSDTVEIKAEIDTGCDRTLIPISLVRKLKLKWTGTEAKLVGVEEDPSNPRWIKFYLIRLIVEDVDEMSIVVGAADCAPLIGRDVINRWHILLTPKFATFEIVARDKYKLGV